MASDKFVGPMTAPIPLLKRLVTLTAQLNEAGGTFLTEAEANALYLKQASNLSDLSNAGTARTNLGLGALDSPTFAGLTLSSPLTVGNGGTGLSAIADASVLVTNAANTLSVLTAAAGQSIRRNAGNTAWEAYTPAGGATLDAVSAAVGNQAGISNGNFNIRWNWQKTSNSQAAFEFGESAASTGGTSTSGVPNQVIAKFSTVAASTASPLSVYRQGTHVFSVSPSTSQILATFSSASIPVYSFTDYPSVGFNATGGPALTLIANNSIGGYVRNTGIRSGPGGSAASPSFSWEADSDTGFYAVGGNLLSLSTGGVENVTWSSNTQQASRGSDDTSSYLLSFRKARGTVAAPTVITTGDDLLKIGGYGYVGATNTYVEAANITFDSTGTITDSSTGIGGVIRFNTRVSGSAIAEAANIIGTVLNVASSVATPAGGSTSARLIFGTTSGFGIYYGSGAPSVSAAQGSLYLRSDGSSTSTRLYVNTDGGTTWTNFTSAT